MRSAVAFALLACTASPWRRAAADTAATVTQVSSVRQFLAAIDAGAEHIEVLSHLDLSGIKGHPDPAGEYNSKATKPKPSTRSIRVRTPEAAP